jgi:hypothetical protein
MSPYDYDNEVFKNRLYDGLNTSYISDEDV